LGASAAPIRFATWMGGDRDGNPNVTATVTREVLMLARWMAADLYLRDVDALQGSLSMTHANAALMQRAQGSREPYRAVLKEVRDGRPRDWAEGRTHNRRERAHLFRRQDLRTSGDVSRSLHGCGMGLIADGPLLDTLRRVAAFGTRWFASTYARVRIATRWCSARSRSISACCPTATACRVVQQRQEFLLAELVGRRPCFRRRGPSTTAVGARYVRGDRVAAQCRRGAIRHLDGHVAERCAGGILLTRSAGLERPLPVVPLFKTLADLDGAAATVDALLAIPWYRRTRAPTARDDRLLGFGQGRGPTRRCMGAVRAQGSSSKSRNVTAARRSTAAAAQSNGGGPASGDLATRFGASSLRAEQGEVIRFKLGNAGLATETLTFSPPCSKRRCIRRRARAEWRARIGELSSQALAAYRRGQRRPRVCRCSGRSGELGIRAR
jgi:phosphoenolpyruvate carboxylase